MKVFWKIYFTFTVLLLLTTGFFGTWMIQRTFQQSYQKVLEEGERENRMFQLSFEMNMNALDDTFRRSTIVPVIGSSITQNLSSSGYCYRIYNELQEIQYETESSYDYGKDLRESLDEEHTSGYTVIRKAADTYLVYACKSQIYGFTYYLETWKNISNIYEEREGYYDWYTMVMLILMAVTTVVVFWITHLLTRSIDELSQTTRRFTLGNYEVRASEQGDDEIAELACDFNDMADTISEKMKELTMQAKRQEDFTASFAHELKTPLTSIIGYADMLRTMDCTEEERREAVNYIFKQGKRLESLSFKLLELIVTGNQEYQFQPLSIRLLAKEAGKITQAGRDERQIAYIMDLKDDLIEGEKDLLISMLVNLLDNARKAVSDGGKIWLQGKQYSRNYLLCVTDNGRGMTKEDVSRITEAFYMADKSRARKEGGAGLGMTLVKKILDVHHARLRIFSIPGKGTAIAICFPKKEEVL